jgi:hypothetical protein
MALWQNKLKCLSQDQCFKPFYGHKFRLFIISCSVCSWHSFST